MNFKHIASGIPQQPGIYKYYDAGNELIYVGKAKTSTQKGKLLFYQNTLPAIKHMNWYSAFTV